MVTVAIIGIITMFALPSYINSQRRAKIAEGVAALVNADSNIEKYRSTNNNQPYEWIASNINTIPGFDLISNAYYSDKLIYKITIGIPMVEGKPGQVPADDLGVRLTATAVGDWLNTNDECFTLTYYISKKNLEPAGCQR